MVFLAQPDEGGGYSWYFWPSLMRVEDTHGFFGPA
jgi:hypothetical protein